MKTAALVEPLAVGTHAAKLGEVKTPKTVVILGGGCIGLCTLLSCKQLGATKVIVSDLFQKRLDVAKELGADEIVNASECDSVEKIYVYKDKSMRVVFKFADVVERVNDVLGRKKLVG